MSRLDELLSKKMTRGQFLATLGLGVASIFGLSSLIGLLTPSERRVDDSPVDYGMRNYGP